MNENKIETAPKSQSKSSNKKPVWDPSSIAKLADHQDVVCRTDDMADFGLKIPAGHCCEYIKVKVAELRRVLHRQEK